MCEDRHQSIKLKYIIQARKNLEEKGLQLKEIKTSKELTNTRSFVATFKPKEYLLGRSHILNKFNE